MPSFNKNEVFVCLYTAATRNGPFEYSRFRDACGFNTLLDDRILPLLAISTSVPDWNSFKADVLYYIDISVRYPEFTVSKKMSTHSKKRPDETTIDSTRLSLGRKHFRSIWNLIIYPSFSKSPLFGVDLWLFIRQYRVNNRMSAGYHNRHLLESAAVNTPDDLLNQSDFVQRLAALMFGRESKQGTAVKREVVRLMKGINQRMCDSETVLVKRRASRLSRLIGEALIGVEGTHLKLT
jgi:hypothetical protein